MDRRKVIVQSVFRLGCTLIATVLNSYFAKTLEETWETEPLILSLVSFPIWSFP